jgi:hypothetical protein
MTFDLSAQIKAWRDDLLDTTKRNRLINLKTGRYGGIQLVHPDPGSLWLRLVARNEPLTFPWQRDLIDLPDDQDGADQSPTPAPAFFDPDGAPEPDASGPDVLECCRCSTRLRADHVLTDLPDRRLAARLARLALNGRESLTEGGVTTLFVAFGLLRWYESPDSQVEIRSPLLLVPVRLERESVESPWRLQAEEEVLPNHSLAQLMNTDFRLRLPLADDEAGDPDDAAWRTRYFAAVRESVRHYPRWEVLDEAALGAFNFQKLAMWDDLGRNQDRIRDHDLCRAIAGDRSAVPRVPSDLPRAEELDEKTRPVETYHILDADSSQHEAIAAAVRGASLVLDGPPGTGKSQTIANIIAESLAAGKTVLFVSEKTAALEVVKRRLDNRQLGDFCLECHSHKANKREVVTELGRCLSLAPEAYLDPNEDLEQLYETRTRLNAYVRELHAVRQPLGLSAYQVHGRLARLARLTSTSRCPIPQVLEQSAEYLRRVTDLLARLPDCRSIVENPNGHPWRGCRAAVYSLTLRDEVGYHFGRLAGCVRQALEASALLHELGFGGKNPTMTQWLTALQSAHTVLSCPLVPAAWFASSPRVIAEAFVQLDRASQRYRQVRGALREFSPEALRQADPSLLTACTTSPDASRPRLLPHADNTVRALRQRLARLGKGLRDLQQQAGALEQATRTVVGLLQVPLSALAVKKLGRLAGLAGHVARMKPARRSWWNAARREELQGALTRCQEEAGAAQELRKELMGRLSPQAFAAESGRLAARARGFKSFLQRLLRLPRWLAFKSQVSGWYTQEPPSTAALLDDLGKLDGYHRRVEHCRQVQAQYAADLLADAEGQPDWAGMLEGLRSVDRLEQVLRTPPALQAALSAEGFLDRGGLAAAAAELARQVASLQLLLEGIGRDYDLGEVQDGPSRHIKCTAQGLAAWLAAQATAVEREVATLDRLCTLLADGQDLALAEVAGRLRSLTELIELRQQVARLRDQLGLKEESRRLEEFDWSQLRSRAEGLLRFFDAWNQAPAPPVVQALTVPQVRARVEEAVRRCDAARTEGLDESWAFLTKLFDPAQVVSTGITLHRAGLADLFAWLTDRTGDAHRIHEWTQFREIEREMRQAGVVPFLAEVPRGEVTLAEAGDAFRARFFRLWLDARYERVLALRQFGGDNHERLIERFRALDRRAVRLAPHRIRHFLLTRPDRPRALGDDAPGSSELGTLLREVNKKRRHLPLRKLFAALPSLLPRLKPCLMMSPLAVSTFLESPDLRFDLVIFDEASQVRPHDAICAIYRGRQLVIAGDQKQLPPTSFFDRMLGDEGGAAEGEEDGTSLNDYESVLDVCCTLGLPRRRLRWHYRSRREALIAFSNQFVYGNELVTFPSVHDVQGNPAVAFEYVAQGRWKAGTGGGYNAVEARRTAELILDHFREHPDKSLGVIAFSQRQQMRVLDELEQLRRVDPGLEEFFREGREEPFFVKNLENVQGDERDVIFLSVGYGPDETGRVAMRFGPLNREGGERRLNVAVTRARERMTVVTSLRAQDLDLSRTGAVGVRLLRAYLDYADKFGGCCPRWTRPSARGWRRSLPPPPRDRLP